MLQPLADNFIIPSCRSESHGSVSRSRRPREYLLILIFFFFFFWREGGEKDRGVLSPSSRRRSGRSILAPAVQI